MIDQLKVMENKGQPVDPNLTAYLIDCLKRNYTERFQMTTKLYKIKKMMEKATVTHQPYNR